MTHETCRVCHAPLTHTFVDLGVSPLANSYVKAAHLHSMEPFYPLHTYVCDQCFLVQLGQFESPEHIFGHYLYYSSYSSSWLQHAERYTRMAVDRFQLNHDSQVIEIASNDGYLLQYFQERGIQVLGIEPAKNVAEIAAAKGIPTLTEFFDAGLARQLAEQGIQADLMVANNVLAHVPDLHGFIAGFKILLRPGGTITFEFPHLLQLMVNQQFDTIYHEHFSYLSLQTVQTLLSHHQLQVVDVEELNTHGGSLRLFVKHADVYHALSPNVAKVIQEEQAYGLDQLAVYNAFARKVEQMKRNIWKFFTDASEQNKQIAGYGAPAKGNTLLNYCGIDAAMLPYTVDQNPHKQGLYLPGSRIPVMSHDELRRTRPDYVLILPWNLKSEIMEACAFIRDWGGQFVVLVPEVEVS